MSSSPSASPQLSLCMIVRNEQATIRRCLESVRGVVDDVVVVDTGSADATARIATECGARVVSAPWENDFSRARNRSLAEARGAWILVLDADEYLEPEQARALGALMQRWRGRSPDRAFQLINKSTSDGGRSGASAYIIRLFPNRPDIRYRWPIHEQVGTSLQQAGVPVENTVIVILHTGYSDPARNREKQERNRRIFAAQLERGEDVTAMTYYLLGGCLLDLGDAEAALQAYGQCRRLAALEPGGAAVADGAQVRILTCMNRLQRWDEVVAAVALPWSQDWHPELFTSLGHAEAQRGREDEGRGWYERVFDCPDIPRIPACNLPAEKIAALKFLGDYWYRRRALPRAVALLRAAKALHEQGRGFSGVDLQSIYAAAPADLA